ncbi:MAG: TRAP transporter fused permease subunit [Thermodesulfobacteriota bacterium]
MRSLTGFWNILIIVDAVAAGLFHYYTSGFGSPEPRVFRGLHVLMLLPIIFILFPATQKSPQKRPSVFDLLWVAICVIASGYTIVQADRLNQHFIGLHKVRFEEVVLGGLLALLSLEAVRRSLSKYYALTVSIILVYLFTCHLLSGVFYFSAFSLDRAVEILYLPNDDGVFGWLIGISAELLFIYILFASVMTTSGTGEYLIQFSTWLAGWAKGGPAKVAVIASALYGTVSGSTVANVFATGSFTIPLMKRFGYRPKEAAAIEAVSGVGGQIMPPIMGAGAFIMSEVTGIPYFTIIKVAAIPAVLYYLGIMFMVHFIALKRGAKAVPPEERPSTRLILKRSYFFLPFASIIGFLAYGYSPTKAAFHSIWITLLLTFLDRRTWLNARKILEMLVSTLRSAALIAAVLACAGMALSVLTRTGLALAFNQILFSASQGILLVALLLVFAVVSIVGTGIPTTAAYIICVTVSALVLSNFGVPALAAHLFVFYYAVLADLTPPDAVTAFAAANIAGSEPMATGFEGFKLGIAGFLVPFAFVFNPELLLNGTIVQIIITFIMTSIAVMCLAAGIIGHLFTPLSFLQRLLLFIAACCAIYPSRLFDLVGLGLALLVFMWSYTTRDREPVEAPIQN